MIAISLMSIYVALGYGLVHVTSERQNATANAPDVQRAISAPGACNLVPDLVYQGEPVYAGDCVPLVPGDEPTATETATSLPDTDTPVVTLVVTPTATETLENTATDTPEPTATQTVVTPVVTLSDTPLPPTATAIALVAPYPGAPLCADHGAEHDNGRFHTIWDSVRGCHYDHEHGQTPFTPAVGAAFPGFDLLSLLGTMGVGHTNPSSPAENVAKHGGFKWQVDLAAPNGCTPGFEGGTVAVDAYAIQYHAFGPQSVELEARNHSAAALLRLCKPGSDYGYLYVTTLQEYGERCFPYQGQTLLYPDNFLPLWDCRFGPYFTTEGFGPGSVRPNLAYYDNALNHNNLTVWSSKRTGPVSSPRPPVPLLFRLLFRGRDAYQSLDASDLVHPFTWRWACGGVTYNPDGCRYNNSSITIHEVAGDIPAAWDNLAGWDTEPQVGRVTVSGYVNQHGQPAAVCLAPGTTCYVVEAVRAFVGRYSSDFCAVKCSNPTPGDTPERDYYFLNGLVVDETTPGAVPSGWIGAEN